MCVFAQADISTADWSSSDHPHPLFRAINALYTVPTCQISGDSLSDVLLAEGSLALPDTLSAWNTHVIPGTKGIALDTAEALLEDSQRLFNESAPTYRAMENMGIRTAGNAVCRFLLQEQGRNRTTQ